MIPKKICARCNIEKPFSDFHKNHKTKDGLNYYCKRCRSIEEKKRADKPGHKERVYNNSLMRMYGIDINRYNQILESQNYICAICGSTEIGTKHQKNFHVDHCHITKKVRGLLCKSCNIMLGEAKDDPRIISRAIEYLERSRQ